MSAVAIEAKPASPFYKCLSLSHAPSPVKTFLSAGKHCFQVASAKFSMPGERSPDRRSTQGRLKSIELGACLWGVLVLVCIPPSGYAGGKGMDGLHWQGRPEPRETAIDIDAPESDEHMRRENVAEEMRKAVREEGARVKRAHELRNLGSGTKLARQAIATLREDGSIEAMSRSRKDSSVWYADEALREAVEDRPDVFQHPPIEDSDELSLWLSIAEAQAKVERRQRELNRRLWVATKASDVAAARHALMMGASPNATDPNGSPLLILAAGGG